MGSGLRGHGQEGKLTTIFYLSYHLFQSFFTARYLLTYNLLHTEGARATGQVSEKIKNPNQKDEACRKWNRRIGKQLKIMPVESVKKREELEQKETTHLHQSGKTDEDLDHGNRKERNLSKRTRLLERTKNYTKKTRAGHRRIWETDEEDPGR